MMKACSSTAGGVSASSLGSITILQGDGGEWLARPLICVLCSNEGWFSLDSGIPCDEQGGSAALPNDPVQRVSPTGGIPASWLGSSTVLHGAAGRWLSKRSIGVLCSSEGWWLQAKSSNGILWWRV